jgi:hypothetical protein
MSKKIPRDKMNHATRSVSRNKKRDSRNGENPVVLYHKLHKQKSK